MAIKKEVSHRVTQKVCHLHNGIFHSIPVHLCHTLSVLLYRFPCVIHYNKLWNERKEGFFQRIT